MYIFSQSLLSVFFSTNRIINIQQHAIKKKKTRQKGPILNNFEGFLYHLNDTIL